MNTGQTLYQKAKQLIPGGTQLLSKRPEMFLPELWPAYYSRAKGCQVWDLDDKAYFDFAQMGVGSCTLGYSDDEVNAAVNKAVSRGAMCTLNAPEEVTLAEKLIELHPWAGMVRYAKTGGEACAIAVRIARAASGRTGVAFCGYHGWHDWYLAANLADDKHLDGQLLPGLAPKGVARGLTGTTYPFSYNKLNELEAIIKKHGNEIGVIFMEPQRSEAPQPGFLEGVRAIANRIGAVLVFDEITSGFRMNLGGIHLTHGVNPDIAVFGKALGNGFPISAVIGIGSVMQSAQDTFISSTFWTDRIGVTAALATLEAMEKRSTQVSLIHHGVRVSEGWMHAAHRASIPIHVSGIPPLTHISFDTDEPLAAQTLYAQEMLEAGYLVGAAVYTTQAYTDQIVDRYIEQTFNAFVKIRQAIESGNICSHLKHEPKHSGFARLT